VTFAVAINHNTRPPATNVKPYQPFSSRDKRLVIAMGRGALVFKGETKKKTSKTKHSKKEQSVTVANSIVIPTLQAVPPAAQTKRASTPQIKHGIGKITTSGTVVMGHGTKFSEQVHAGDAFLVTIDGTQEMRVITMRLSDISLNLSSGFSQNMATPVPFQFISKPRDASNSNNNGNVAEQREAREKALQEERHAFGLYSNEELVYQERTEHGNYRTKRVKVDGKVSRQELLDLRTKKKSDRFC
jgi:hypothetical protein